MNGVAASALVDGAMNGETFLTWVEGMLVRALKPGDIVVMDNLPAHKVAGERAAAEQAARDQAARSALSEAPSAQSLLETQRYEGGDSPHTPSSRTQGLDLGGAIQSLDLASLESTAAPIARRDASSASTPHAQTKWWMPSQTGQAQTGRASLQDALAGLNAQDAASHNTRQSAQASTEQGAQRDTAGEQRLIQAMAAFRGSSGVPVMTRHDANGIAHESWQIAKQNKNVTV